MVFKDYKMKGYTLHTIKTDKFKMCHVEVIFRNNVVKEEITKIINEYIKEINSKLAEYKKIKKVELRDKPFEETSTQKIKRYVK